MSDGQGKTEQATPRRRQQARKEGQVSRSEDLLHVVLFGIFFSYLIIDGSRLAYELIAMIVLPYDYFNVPFSSAASSVAGMLLSKAMQLTLSILIATVVFSFTVQLIQIGPLFSPKSITPSLKKLNVVNNIKEIFSVKSLVDLLKMIVKTLLMTFIIYLVLRGNLGLLLSIPPRGVEGILYAERRIMQHFTMLVFFTFAVIALFDIFWQRRLLSKQLMMQKHEVKREHKDNEGDPHVKDFRRNLLREIVFGDPEHVQHASAVVANPTHLAIALYYKPPLTGLPMILAKGQDDGAQAIFRAARRAGVPIIRNVPVARSLYQVDLYNPIPTEMIEAVAEIIVAAQQMRAASGYDDQPDDEPPDIASQVTPPNPI